MMPTYELTGDKELQKYMKDLIRKKSKEVKGETYAHGLDVQREAKKNLNSMRRWDTGNLANSIIVDLERAGFTVKIEATAPYAIYVEHGARPHFPPPDALEGWAKRHGFDSAWPICKAISERGLPESPFLGPAYMAIRDKYYAALKRLLEK